MKRLSLLSLSILLYLCACSDNNDSEQQKQKAHVWQEQSDALDKAKAVDGIIQDSAAVQQKHIQDETQ